MNLGREMIQKFNFGNVRAVVLLRDELRGEARGGVVELTLREPGRFGREAAVEMTPDEAVAMAGALERAAFIQRRAERAAFIKRRAAAAVAAAKEKLAEQVQAGSRMAVVRVD